MNMPHVLFAVLIGATLLFAACVMFLVLKEGGSIVARTLARTHTRRPLADREDGWRLSLASHSHGWPLLRGGGGCWPRNYSSTAIRTRKDCAFTNRCLVSLLFLIVLPSLAWPQESAPSQSRQGDEYTIRVNADSVVLHATVQNHKGILVSGLGKDDFQVYEDGVLQQIEYFSHEDIPVTVGLVVDNSGSMGPKRPEVIAAALAFARSSNPQDQMFVVNFNEHVSFGLPDNTPFTDQVAQLEVALSRIDADGETALYDAVAVALEHLKKGNRDKKVLIVVSDGGDNASKHNLGQVMAMAGQSDAIIYTIGIFDDGRSRPEPWCAQAACQGHGWRGFLAGVSKGRCPYL